MSIGIIVRCYRIVKLPVTWLVVVRQRPDTVSYQRTLLPGFPLLVFRCVWSGPARFLHFNVPSKLLPCLDNFLPFTGPKVWRH